MLRKLVLGVLALGTAISIFAMPDYLYNTELARQNAFGLLLAGGVEYYQGDRAFDGDGNKTLFNDTGTKSDHILVPVKFGFYLPNPQWSWYVTLPIIAQNYVASTNQVTKHDVGLANPYLVGRWLPALNSDVLIGPRIALRIAGLSKTVLDSLGNTELPSGDKSWGFDGGFLFAYHPQTNLFRLDGQAGLRYLFPADYKLSMMGTTLFDYKETPATSVRGEVAPGLAWANGWVIYAKAYGSFDVTTGKIHNNTYDMDQNIDKTQLYGAGLRQSWEINTADELGLEFDYDISGKATEAGWHLTADYVGYLPM